MAPSKRRLGSDVNSYLVILRPGFHHGYDGIPLTGLSEKLTSVNVQPNAVTIETGLFLGLKARVNAAQGASPGLDCPQKKILGLMRDFIP